MYRCDEIHSINDIVATNNNAMGINKRNPIAATMPLLVSDVDDAELPDLRYPLPS